MAGTPFLLTWVHREVFRELLESNDNISHFLYVEDDIEVTPSNIEYWLESRAVLQPYGLYPSFLRFELNENGERVSTDVKEICSIYQSPHVPRDNGYLFVNLRQPYQGMYLMDRALMTEFVGSPAFSPDFGKWNIREKAAQGLTFYNVPRNCFSRNFIGFDLSLGVDRGALIHHLPNNYALDPDTKFGKIRVEDVLTLTRPDGVRDRAMNA